MNGDLRSEMAALREASFGPSYITLRRRLDRRGNEKRREEFYELEDHFFQLVTYVLSNQGPTGWWMPGHELRNVITAHALVDAAARIKANHAAFFFFAAFLAFSYSA
jgi:hypothetical protein